MTVVPHAVTEHAEANKAKKERLLKTRGGLRRSIARIGAGDGTKIAARPPLLMRLYVVRAPPRCVSPSSSRQGGTAAISFSTATARAASTALPSRERGLVRLKPRGRPPTYGRP